MAFCRITAFMPSCACKHGFVIGKGCRDVSNRFSALPPSLPLLFFQRAGGVVNCAGVPWGGVGVRLPGDISVDVG